MDQIRKQLEYYENALKEVPQQKTTLPGISDVLISLQGRDFEDFLRNAFYMWNELNWLDHQEERRDYE